MALSVVQCVGNEDVSGGSATTIVVTISTTTGNLLLACVRNGANTTSTMTVADSNSVSWTASKAGPITTGRACEWFFLANGTNTAVTTVTATYSTSISTRSMYVIEVSGAAITSPEDSNANSAVNAANAASGTSLTSASYSTSNANDILVAGYWSGAGGETYTADTGAGWAFPTGGNSLTRGCVQTKIVSSTQSAQTTSISGTPSTTNRMLPLASFIAAAANTFTYFDMMPHMRIPQRNDIEIVDY